MGHERVGVLPKTDRWSKVVVQLGEFTGGADQAQAVASTTLENVRSRLEAIEHDQGVQSAFKFLVTLSSSRASKVIPRGGPSTPLALARILHRWIEESRESLEYAQIAEGAANDAIAARYRDSTKQTQLFADPVQGAEIWGDAATAGGFCELARLFFANFTERYLNYFLEREASVVTGTIGRRNLLAERLRDRIDGISRHAFETAKITQSLAAGWYHRHVSKSFPSESELAGFLAIAFGKIREELRRESRD